MAVVTSYRFICFDCGERCPEGTRAQGAGFPGCMICETCAKLRSSKVAVCSQCFLQHAGECA